VFLLVPAHPGSPGQRAIKRLLLLLLCFCDIVDFCPTVFYTICAAHLKGVVGSLASPDVS